MLSQTSCLPLSCPGQRRPQPEDGSGPKPTHSPAPELLSSPVQPAGAEVASCKASPRETQEHPFQTDLPSIMKPPQSHTRNGQQCWHRQEEQSPRWEPAQCRWCPQPSKPRWSHAVSPRRSQMHRFSQRQHKADRVGSGSHPFHPLLCQA